MTVTDTFIVLSEFCRQSEASISKQNDRNIFQSKATINAALRLSDSDRYSSLFHCISQSKESISKQNDIEICQCCTMFK